MTYSGRRSPTRSAVIAAAILWGALFVALVVGVDWSVYLDWLIAGTATTLLFYAVDKVQAKRFGRRVPEIVLQGLVLAGGVVGGWVGMLVLRHKTRHRKFWVVQGVATVVWAAVAWVVWLR
jgi:uncharacterized membrane protein YsdA (DUF1294 family)